MDEQILKELRARRERIEAGGGQAKLDKRREKGLMNARERLTTLFDPDTFLESGMHVEHRCTDFGLADKKLAADGVVTGIGQVAGSPVAAYSQDFTVQGGTLGHAHAQKMADAMDQALTLGVPVVGFNDSGGARIQEGVGSLSGYGMVFNRNVRLSGVVPQIAVIAGPCAGGAAYSPALCDFVVMVRRSARMFICGPEVIQGATGQKVTMEDVGDAAVHANVSGNAHFVVEEDADAVALVRDLLSYLPPNNVADPPHDLSQDVVVGLDESLADLIPEHSNQAFDVHDVITRIIDGGRFLEVHAEFARNIVVGFARIGGVVVGVVANNPLQKAGTLDIDSSDKGARFIRFCDCFSIPLVTLVDTPGFLPGLQQERGGIIRHGAKMLFSYASTTVPKITVILRKAYGGAYLAMCSKDMEADAVFAWPGAEIAVMGAPQASRILNRKQIQAAEDPETLSKELAEDYRQRFSNPYQAARMGMLTDVIEPGETRSRVAATLRAYLGKRVTRPPKKHGNIPL